jgi:anthranilate phosphoribosyltransferase
MSAQDTRIGPPEFSRPPGTGGLTPALHHLLRGGTLDAEQTTATFETIMTGQAHPGEIGALLALLSARAPTAEEILGAARVMRAHVDRVESRRDPGHIVDTAGTGGAPKTFNVSTAAALIAAAAGADRIAVAKHGNRSRTGRGSAEVLKGLGINVDADRAVQARCLDEAGICFCFAIHHHPAARHAMPVRQVLGFPTIFNLLGPLTNPAGAQRQLLGVYDRCYLEPIAGALNKLGALRAMVVHSDDGLDEISITAPTQVLHVGEGKVRRETISPEKLGLAGADMNDLVARDLDHAVAMVLGIIDGTDTGPPRDMAVLNAAATLLVAGAVESLEDGLVSAAEAIHSGAARQTLQKLVQLSNGPST